MLVIAPPPLASITGRAARVARTAVMTLRFQVRAHCSSVTCVNPAGRAGALPTLFTSTSSRSPVAATSRAGPSGAARSTSTGVIDPPLASSSSSGVRVREPATTCAPSATNARVTASPMPRPAPVTTTRLPTSSRSTMVPFRRDDTRQQQGPARPPPHPTPPGRRRASSPTPKRGCGQHGAQVDLGLPVGQCSYLPFQLADRLVRDERIREPLVHSPFPHPLDV